MRSGLVFCPNSLPSYMSFSLPSQTPSFIIHWHCQPVACIWYTNDPRHRLYSMQWPSSKWIIPCAWYSDIRGLNSINNHLFIHQCRRLSSLSPCPIMIGIPPTRLVCIGYNESLLDPVFSSVFDTMGSGWFSVQALSFPQASLFNIYQWSLAVWLFKFSIYIQWTIVTYLLPPTTRLVCIEYDESLDTI